MKIHFNSPVILSYTLASLITLLLGADFTLHYATIHKTSFGDPLQYVRLFTHVLGHRNWDHYLSNFLFILLLGPMLEEKYGWKKILLMLPATALLTGLVNILLFPTGLCGASGVVFMMIVLSSFVNVKQGGLPVTFILVVLLYVGKEIVGGIAAKDDISQLSHILGGIVGAVFGMMGKTGKTVFPASSEK